MHNAKVESSNRLQRVLAVLQEATGELSTRDICFAANVHALSSIISELRAPPNNFKIACRQVMENGERRWLYRLVRPVEQKELAL